MILKVHRWLVLFVLAALALMGLSACQAAGKDNLPAGSGVVTPGGIVQVTPGGTPVTPDPQEQARRETAQAGSGKPAATPLPAGGSSICPAAVVLMVGTGGLALRWRRGSGKRA
jgi:protein-disulfide isomerase